jgi:hypothetical protein
MAFFPIRGFALWVTYTKVKIKIEKIEDLAHGFSLARIVSEFKLICQGGNSRSLGSPGNLCNPDYRFCTGSKMQGIDKGSKG